MIFHLSYERPKKKEEAHLNADSWDLTSEETRILKRQIRQNSKLINEFVERLDLLVNKERYPGKAVFIQKIRRRLELLMEENDTFRKVLWRHLQARGV